jgi:hypothetical protein
MANLRASIFLALTLTACGAPSSMIRYASASAASPPGYGLRFYAEGPVLAARLTQPMGAMLFFDDPRYDHGRVVLTPAIVSSGAAGEDTQCWVIEPVPGWEDRVVFREPDGTYTPITVERGESATPIVAACAPHGQ